MDNKQTKSEAKRSFDEFELAWSEFYRRRPRPKNDDEEKQEGIEFAFWYNNVRKQTDTGKTPAEMGQRILEYGETSEKAEQDYYTQQEPAEILELSDNREYEKALKRCDRLLMEMPENFDAMLLKAETQIMARKMTAAKNTLDKCEKIDPENPAVHFHRAEIFIIKKDHASAVREIDKAIEKEPRNFDYLMLKAQALSFMNDPSYKGVLKELETIDRKRLENFMDNHWIETNRNTAKETEKTLGEARDLLWSRDPAAFLEKAKDIQHMPLGREFREMLKGLEVEKCFERENIPEAKKLAEELLEENPMNPHAHYYKANIQLHEGRPSEALETIDECIRVAEKRRIPHFDYYSYKARILKVLGKDYAEWEQKAQGLMEKAWEDETTGRPNDWQREGR